MTHNIENALQKIDRAIYLLDDLVGDGRYGELLEQAFGQLSEAGNNLEKLLKKLERDDGDL